MHYWINALLVDADELLPLARAADALGFAGIALADHPVMPEVIHSTYPGGAIPWDETSTWPDVWVQIGAMAAVTRQLRFATNVYVLPARHPLVTAKAVSTAAALSENRVVLGVGVGWMAEESEAMGQEFSNRGARADEALAILRMAFAGGPVAYAGRHYSVPRLRLNPAPSKPVPIWVGGESQAALRRAARLGDGWISGRTPADLATQLPELQRELEAAGRAEAPFELVASAAAAPSDAELARWTQLGIDHLKVQPWTWDGPGVGSLGAKLESLQRFAAKYLD